MAIVTGLTAARMLEIENASVVSGHILGDNLVLVTHGGTEVTAGNVRGITGPVGPASTPNPTGTVLTFAGAAAPSGYMICDGSAISRTTYAALFSVIGVLYGPGDGSTTFNLPDMRSRMVMGLGTDEHNNVLGERYGFRDASLVYHRHDEVPHAHTTASHSHSLGTHSHGVNLTTSAGGDGQVDVRNQEDGMYLYSFSGLASSSGPITGLGGLAYNDGDTGFAGKWAIDLPQHSHSVSGSTDLGGSGSTTVAGGAATGLVSGTKTDYAGAAATDNNLPPYVTMNFVIKT